jgi:hypothetical protein
LPTLIPLGVGFPELKAQLAIDRHPGRKRSLRRTDDVAEFVTLAGGLNFVPVSLDNVGAANAVGVELIIVPMILRDFSASL